MHEGPSTDEPSKTMCTYTRRIVVILLHVIRSRAFTIFFFLVVGPYVGQTTWYVFCAKADDPKRATRGPRHEHASVFMFRTKIEPGKNHKRRKNMPDTRSVVFFFFSVFHFRERWGGEANARAIGPRDVLYDYRFGVRHRENVFFFHFLSLSLSHFSLRRDFFSQRA